MKQVLQIEHIDAHTLMTRLERIETLLNAKADVRPSSSPIFLTREQVAAKLAVSEVTVWDWTKKGILKKYSIGTKVRYVEAEVISAVIGKGGSVC